MSLTYPEPIRSLDKNIARSLHAGQVIINVESIVKELIENSLDAHASSIDILLVGKGLIKIQVKDDGWGIPDNDRASMAKLYSTSKITQYNHLEELRTFGFRGEALNSICETASNVQVVTKTTKDSIAKSYSLDTKGRLHDERHAADISNAGTIVCVYGAFSKLPVRRQVAQNTASGTAKKVQDLVIRYSLSHPAVRFSYTHKIDGSSKQDCQWIKPKTGRVIDSISYVYKPGLAPMLRSMEHTKDSVTFVCVLPKIDADPSIVCQKNNLFIYVNRRPINHVASGLKEIAIMCRKYYLEAASINKGEYNMLHPFLYLDIQLCPDQYEINLDPGKSVIMLNGREKVLNAFEGLMIMAYGMTIGEIDSTRQNDCTELLSGDVRIQHMPAAINRDFDDHDNGQLTHPRKNSEPRRGSETIMPNSSTSVVTRKQTPTDDLDGPNPINQHVWKFSMYSEASSDDEDQEAEEQETRTYEECDPVPQIPTILSWLKNPVKDLANPAVISPHTAEGGGLCELPPDEETMKFVSNGMDWQLEGSLAGSQQDHAVAQSAVPNISICSVNRTRPSSKMHERPGSQRIPIQSFAPAEVKTPASLRHVPASHSNKSTTPQKRRRRQKSSGERETSRRNFPGKTQFASKWRNYFTRTENEKDCFHGPNNISHNKDESLTNTANLEQKVLYTIDRIRAIFHNRQRRTIAMQHMSVHEYFQAAKTTDPTACSYTLLSLLSVGHDLRIYASGNYDAVNYGKVAQEIGVIDLVSARRNYTLYRYINDHELVTNKYLDSPIRIIVAAESSDSSVISSLENDEQVMLDDTGQKMLYHSVTDRRITANGFQVRWIKNEREIMIELLSICELNDYVFLGPTELLEILSLIQRQLEHSGQSWQGLARFRPKKVIRYFHQVAGDASPHHESDAEVVELALLCDAVMETPIARIVYPIALAQ